MQYLKEATAATIVLGPFLDDTDGKTPEAGLTISQADVILRKNGAAGAQKNDATAATADGTAGYYTCPINATDTGTIGRLLVTVSESGALPIRHEYQVIPAEIYDALFGSSANGFDSSGRVDVGSVLGNPASASGTVDANIVSISNDVTAADNLEAAFDGDGYNFLSCTIDANVASVATAAITDIWSTDTLPEAYAADGAAGTPAQMLYMIQQAITEMAISGTTLTVKKLDGSTTAATFTLDDASNPTSRTRAS